MYQIKQNFLLVASLFTIFSCSKNVDMTEGATGTDSVDYDNRIVFKAEGEGLDLDVTTKATEVTSLTSFNVVCEDASSTAKQKWSSTATKSESGNNYVTDKYWPLTDSKYSFYASNLPLTYATSGTTVSPSNNTTDAIVAYKAYSASDHGKSITLNFDHIYCRLRTVKATAKPGYTISNVSCSLSAPVGGTYNLKTKSWTSQGTASPQSFASFSCSSNVSTSVNDLYLVPGTYALTLKYTLKKGDFTKEYSSTANVKLTQGKINNINASISADDATAVQMTVSIAAWSSVDVTVQL